MKKFKLCLRNLCWHKWIYHNEITRQCLKCGKLQYKSGCFGFWKNIDSYFQPRAKFNASENGITLKKGCIILECAGLQILNDHTRVPKFLAIEIKQDIFFPKKDLEKREVIDE